MGIALYLLWGKRSTARAGLAAFGVQLVLNVLWSVVFFGMHELFCGFVVIAVLWIAIAATIAPSYKVSAGAAGVLVPYLVWVTIASALNYYIWLLNAREPQAAVLARLIRASQPSSATSPCPG